MGMAQIKESEHHCKKKRVRVSVRMYGCVCECVNMFESVCADVCDRERESELGS